MTHHSSEIVIDAAPQTIFGFASQTERWPEFLPHYRYVKLLGERGGVRVVEMAALRDRIPVRWIAGQRNDPGLPQIRFVHLRGWTRGMEVIWRFDRLGPARTRVTIEHDLAFASPIAADLIGRYIVGDFFIANVASKTLARMKVLAEEAS